MSQPELITGTYAELKDRAMPIRYKVFVEEQNVPIELEQDDRDSFCHHVLASIEGQAIGTGRIDIEYNGKIGRVAGLSHFRRQGVGKKIIAHLEEIARKNSLSEVCLNSQVAAIPFYESMGYLSRGEQFSEAGIDHFKMVKSL